MGSYGVIKEALLVKENGATNDYSVVQKLVPATVNGCVISSKGGDFEDADGVKVDVLSVYHGGAFGFSEWSKYANIQLSVNIPGYGVKLFYGTACIENMKGVGNCVKCTPVVSDPNAPYTHLCLVLDALGNVFV